MFVDECVEQPELSLLGGESLERDLAVTFKVKLIPTSMTQHFHEYLPKSNENLSPKRDLNGNVCSSFIVKSNGNSQLEKEAAKGSRHRNATEK